MIFRLRTIAAIATIAGLPYLATQTQLGRDTMATVTESMPVSLSSGDDSGGVTSHHEVEKLVSANSTQYRYESPLMQDLGQAKDSTEDSPRIVGQPVSDLREIIRFDVSPEWVIQRFSRVSTVLADVRLKALRVPIVTGTRVDDLAGTLTYYFDGLGKVQRITMHAFTGDPNRLVGSMVQHYGMTTEPTLEAGVLTKRWNGLPIHFLRMTHNSVVHADNLHQKYTIFMELNQPDLPFGLSREARKIVDHDRLSGRW